MAIEGPLKELGLHDVFQLLDLSRKTGVMRVTSHLRNNEGMVAFDGGAIVFACSHLHEVTEVTQGRRFVLLSFLFGEGDIRPVRARSQDSAPPHPSSSQ